MGKFGREELEKILRTEGVVPPEDCVTYGNAATNAQGGLSVEGPDRQQAFDKLQALHDRGVQQAWLIRLEWTGRNGGGLHDVDPADAVRVFSVDLDKTVRPKLGPTQHPAGQFIKLDQLTQSALDRGLRDEPVPESPAGGHHPAVEVGRPLADRGDADVLYVRKTGDGVMRRRHNSMTNRLKTVCDANGWAVYEDPKGYDALIEGYKPGRDLLVEVKTEATPPFVRMAVGQLFDYRRRVPRRDQTDLAVLLQGRPDDDVLAFLADAGVSVLWLLPDGGGVHGL